MRRDEQSLPSPHHTDDFTEDHIFKNTSWLSPVTTLCYTKGIHVSWMGNSQGHPCQLEFWIQDIGKTLIHVNSSWTSALIMELALQWCHQLKVETVRSALHSSCVRIYIQKYLNKAPISETSLNHTLNKKERRMEAARKQTEINLYGCLSFFSH